MLGEVFPRSASESIERSNSQHNVIQNPVMKVSGNQADSSQHQLTKSKSFVFNQPAKDHEKEPLGGNSLELMRHNTMNDNMQSFKSTPKLKQLMRATSAGKS